MKKKRVCSILLLAGLILLLQTAEWILKKNGLELRTAAQGVKGLFVWLIAPALILLQSYRLLSDWVKSERGRGFLIALFLLLSLALLGGGFIRGLYYLFSGEVVEETVLENGVIEGKYSFGLSETYTKYYNPVFGILRRELTEAELADADWYDAERSDTRDASATGDTDEIKDAAETEDAAETGDTAEDMAEAEDAAETGNETEKTDGTAASQESEEWVNWYSASVEKEFVMPDGGRTYQMVVLDAAAGSRFYGLLQSTEDGKRREVVSLDPFGGRIGGSVDFCFLDENLGFATLSHNGGDEADLYITENGGKSYEPVTIEEITVTLSNGYRYCPYDFPQMPYQEGEKLYVYCGQGADGDYAGGDAAGMALYESADGGHTFTYVETGLPEQ